MSQVNKWSVIFLIDKTPTSKIILLKRSSTKTYAPNFYTGIGGKIGDLPGLENETPLKGAYRELAEETGNELSEKNIKLQGFAQCIYQSGLTIYYFYGLYNKSRLPYINADDGTLEWVNSYELLNKEIIPTTKSVCEEWRKRDFRIDQPFTIYVKEVGRDRTVRLVEITKILDGLVHTK